MSRARLILFACCATLLGLNVSSQLVAQTVWSGLTFEFEKPDWGDPTLPANQDRITDNVWLTRAVQRGIYNISQEGMYDDLTHTSPADTEWATDLMFENDGEAIVATNWEDLTFTTWIDAYGGPGSQSLPQRLIGRNAVVHLITDDIYLDLMFTGWTLGGPGGFSYIRAEGDIPSTPPTGDYNENGVVDAADYVLWRATLNDPAVPAGSGADGNESGAVDTGDYDYWLARFGNSVPGAGSNAVAVPEPSAIATFFTLLGAASTFVFRCRSLRSAS